MGARHKSTLVVVAVLVAAALGMSLSAAVSGASADANFLVVAGDGARTPTPTPSGSTAVSTGLDAPGGVATDHWGNLVICDTSHSEIEVLAESGDNPGYTLGTSAQWHVGSLYVIAGGGSTPPAMTGAPALSTVVNQPGSVAVDAQGNIVLADTQDDNVSVVAVSQSNPGYAVSSWTRGDLYLIAGNRSSTPAPSASETGASATKFGLDRPNGVAMDAKGNVVIDDSSANLVALLAVSSTDPGFRLVTGATWTPGDLYVIAGGGTGAQVPTSSGVTAVSAQLNDPQGVAVDALGNPVFADSGDNEIDVVAESTAKPSYPIGGTWSIGDVYAIVGGGSNAPTSNGVAADDVELGDPTGVAVDASGDLLFSDTSIGEVGVLSETSSNPGYTIGSTALWNSGTVYVVAGGGSNSPSMSGIDALSAQITSPEGISATQSGAIYIADTGDWLIETLDLVPPAPSIASAVAGDASVSLSWTAPSTNGGSPISNYDLLVFDNSGSLLRTIEMGSTTTSYGVTGLTDGTRYSFEVEAVNAIGTSSPSSALSATPYSSVPTATIPPTTSPTVTSTAPVTTTTAPIPKPAAVHRVTSSRLAIVTLVQNVAPVRSGFTTLSVRCSSSRCTGSLRLVGKRVVNVYWHGLTRPMTETFVAASDHFDLRGRREVSVLVPLESVTMTAFEQSKARSLVVVAEFSVEHGKSARYHLELSVGKGSRHQRLARN